MKLPAWLTAQVMSLAAIGVLAWLLVGQVNARREAEARATAATEREQLLKDGLQLAKTENEDAIRRGNYLADALAEQLRKEKVEAHIVFAGTGTTGPVTVGGGTLGGSQTPPSVAQASPAAVPSSPAAGAPASDVLLRRGDKGEIKVTVAGAKTDAGNVVVDGEAHAYANGQHLFGGPLRLDVKVPSPTEPLARGRGVGVGWGVTVGDRLRTGPVIPLPSSLWWKHVEGDYTLSPQCDPRQCNLKTAQVGIQAVWRWR